MNVSALSSAAINIATLPDDGPISLPNGGTGPYAPPSDSFDFGPGNDNRGDLMFANRAPAKGGSKTEVECPEGQHPEVKTSGRNATIICTDDKPASGGKTSPGGAPILDP